MPGSELQAASVAVLRDGFGDRMLQSLNQGALCLMLSLGHRTGLFDAMRDMPPASAAAIAERAALDERYVREWLGAMVAAHVVDFEPSTGSYRLPPEHARHLGRGAGPENLALMAQYLAVLAGVEDVMVERFRHGGGLSYARYPRFHEVMAEDSEQSVLSVLESHVLNMVPGLTERLLTGIRVLDVGCGLGRIPMRLAELFPRSRFTGIDLSAEAIERAREEADARGLVNIAFIAADAAGLGGFIAAESMDLVTTFDAIHDQGHPLSVLRGIARCLRADGVYLMQDLGGCGRLESDVGHPLGTFLYTLSCMHCLPVSRAQGGAGPGAMWGEARTREYLHRAGFRAVASYRLAHDFRNHWYVVSR